MLIQNATAEAGPDFGFVVHSEVNSLCHRVHFVSYQDLRSLDLTSISLLSTSCSLLASRCIFAAFGQWRYFDQCADLPGAIGLIGHLGYLTDESLQLGSKLREFLDPAI